MATSEKGGWVEDWRAGVGRGLDSLLLALSVASVPAFRPCHVSSPRRFERCLLRTTGYETYPAERAFRRSPRTPPLPAEALAVPGANPRNTSAVQPSPWRISSVSGPANQWAVSISPLPPVLPEELQTAGSLCSAGVTPLRRYFGPIRRPLVFDRFPGLPVIRPGVSPPSFRWRCR
jgi:hypothetical protein